MQTLRKRRIFYTTSKQKLHQKKADHFFEALTQEYF